MCYFNKKDKYFHDLKLDKMTMDELVCKSSNLLCCMLYLKEKKEKVHHFLHCLSLSLKERINYENKGTIDEAITKLYICY